MSNPRPGAGARVAACAVFRHTFETAGTYRSVCLRRDGPGMRGTVVVKTGN